MVDTEGSEPESEPEGGHEYDGDEDFVPGTAVPDLAPSSPAGSRQQAEPDCDERSSEDGNTDIEP